MPDPAGTLIVANSFVLAALAGVVLVEQAGEPDDAEPEFTEASARELFETIQRNQHSVVITDKLVEQEYGQAVRRYGLNTLFGTIERLQESGFVRQVRPASPPNLEHIPKKHHTFFREALRTRCRYVLTQWRPWLNLRRRLEDNYNLLVITPEEYVRRQSR